MSTQSLAVLAVASLTVLSLAAGQPSATPVAREAAGPSLVALVEYHPGSESDSAPGGPVLAVWNDGVVIFSHDPCASRNLQIGRVPSIRVEEMLTDLASTGLLDHPRDWNRVPDGSLRSITVLRDGKAITSRWNEALGVPWGAHADARREHKDFAKAWMQARVIFAFTQPGEYKPLDGSSPEAARLKAASAAVR